MMTDGHVTLVLSGIPGGRLSLLTMDLRRDLTRVGIVAHPLEKTSPEGTRGDISLLGQLALGLVSTGAITALVECLKAFLSREKKLEFVFKRADGVELNVNASNLNKESLKLIFQATLEKN